MTDRVVPEAGSTVALLAIDLMQRLLASPLAPHSGETVARHTNLLGNDVRTHRGLVVWITSERPVASQPPGSDLSEQLHRTDGDLDIVNDAGAPSPERTSTGRCAQEAPPPCG